MPRKGYRSKPAKTCAQCSGWVLVEVDEDYVIVDSPVKDDPTRIAPEDVRLNDKSDIMRRNDVEPLPSHQVTCKTGVASGVSPATAEPQVYSAMRQENQACTNSRVRFDCRDVPHLEVDLPGPLILEDTASGAQGREKVTRRQGTIDGLE